MGGSVTIPTIDGDVELNIPAGSQPGDRKTMRKRGMPKPGRYSGDRGDQLITLKVKVPTKLTAKQKELLLEAFGPSSEPVQEKKGIFESFFSSNKESKKA